MKYKTENFDILEFCFRNYNTLVGLVDNRNVVFDNVPSGVAPLLDIVDYDDDPDEERGRNYDAELQRLCHLPVVEVDDGVVWTEMCMHTGDTEHIVRGCNGSRISIYDIIREPIRRNFFYKHDLSFSDLTDISVRSEPSSQRLYLTMVFDRAQVEKIRVRPPDTGSAIRRSPTFPENPLHYTMYALQ